MTSGTGNQREGYLKWLVRQFSTIPTMLPAAFDTKVGSCKVKTALTAAQAPVGRRRDARSILHRCPGVTSLPVGWVPSASVHYLLRSLSDGCGGSASTAPSTSTAKDWNHLQPRVRSCVLSREDDKYLEALYLCLLLMSLVGSSFLCMGCEYLP